MTYVHIKPEMILDLSPCINAFSALYMDLCSARSPVFKLGKMRDRLDGFRCIPFASKMLSDLSTENWFRLFRNYLEFPKATGGIRCRLGYAEDTEKDSDSYDNITKTIVTMDSPVNLPDIATLLLIDPLPFLTGEEETEDNEDLEYFCQDGKEPSMPDQSTKDAIREIIGALDSLVGSLMEYRFNNRLYEAYKKKEQGDA